MAKTKNKARRNQQPNVHTASTHPQGQQSMQNYGMQAVVEPSLNGYTQKVDSWRSYKNDVTNLQTTISAQSTLNAAATDFVPTYGAYQPQNASCTPYQPLRVSNGSTERKVLENARWAMNVTSVDSQSTDGVQPSAGFPTRYPTRSKQDLRDQPLPSVEEGADGNLHALTKTVRDLQSGRYRSRTPPETASPAAPETTEAYRAEAKKSPARLPEPRKLLVVLDLNGTLLYRAKPARTGKIHMRPGVTTFLRYLFENHVVMVYTSAMPQGADRMVQQFLNPIQYKQLAALWTRAKLDLSKAQFYNKVQVYKKLDKIWKDEDIQKTAGPGQRWDQTNTILVDDSKLKALAQPHNLLQVPEYTKADVKKKKSDKKKGDKDMNKIQQEIMRQLELKLEELKYQEDVSRVIRTWQSGEADVPRLPGQAFVVEETVDQKALQGARSGSTDDEGETVHIRPQLPTPQSMADEDEDAIGRPMEISDDEDDQDGGMITGSFVAVNQQPASEQDISTTGFSELTESDDNGTYLEFSPIDESVFRELLEGTGK